MRQEGLKALHSLGLRSKWNLVLPGLLVSATLFISSCSTIGRQHFEESGRASWYGKKFQGRQTANGERFNMHDMTAAHPTLAFGSKVRVRSLTTGKSVVVRINDRGPYVSDRVIDLSYGAAKSLGMVAMGEDQVQIQQIAAP